MDIDVAESEFKSGNLIALSDKHRAVWKTGDQGTPGVIKNLNSKGEALKYNKQFREAFKYFNADIGSPNKLITTKVDMVNATPYGSIDGKDPAEYLNVIDFIPFKFKDVVNNKWINFRAILSGIGDTINPEWSEERYIGRPDKVYVYSGVDRDISFNFNIYPKTKQELPILWEKINYLVGMCYPSWGQYGNNSSNRMIGP